jgi:cell wall assembly regulator SMI1
MDLRATFSRILSRLSASGYDTRPLVFGPPASEAELQSLEADLGHPLPASLREVLGLVSGHVELRWFAPAGNKYPEPLHQNFSGDLHWSLDLIRQFRKDKSEWIETVFKNPLDKYDRVWHDKLAFHEVGNGDYLSLDLATSTFGQVVYLSHDDGEGHGYVMANSFSELLDRWVPLGCTGAEDWQWLPFTNNKSTCIDPTCGNAVYWRSLLRIDA